MPGMRWCFIGMGETLGMTGGVAYLLNANACLNGRCFIEILRAESISTGFCSLCAWATIFPFTPES
jgi:hypothetical protein